MEMKACLLLLGLFILYCNASTVLAPTDGIYSIVTPISIGFVGAIIADRLTQNGFTLAEWAIDTQILEETNNTLFCLQFSNDFTALYNEVWSFISSLTINSSFDISLLDLTIAPNSIELILQQAATIILPCLKGTTFLEPSFLSFISYMTNEILVQIVNFLQTRGSLLANNFIQEMMNLWINSKYSDVGRTFEQLCVKAFEEVNVNPTHYYQMHQKFYSAQASPDTLWNQIYSIGTGMMYAVNSARNKVFKTIPGEADIEKNITSEFSQVLLCLKLNPELIQYYSGLYSQCLNYNYSAFSFLSSNTTILATQIIEYLNSVDNISHNCLASTIYLGPFLSSLVSTLNAKSLIERLNFLQKYSQYQINYNIQLILKYTQKSIFGEVGSYIVQLYTWAYPLLPPFQNISTSVDIPNVYNGNRVVMAKIASTLYSMYYQPVGTIYTTFNLPS